MDLITYLVQHWRDQRGDWQAFVTFAQDFLTKYRIQGIAPEDDNYAILFTNGDRVLICPPSDTQQRLDDINNVDTSGAMPIAARKL